MTSSSDWDSIIKELSTLRADIPNIVGTRADVSQWSSSSRTAKLYQLEQRAQLLQRAVQLNTAETQLIQITQARHRNASSPVGRLPDDILFLIFRAFVATPGCSPSTLASVCHRWMALAFGPMGPSLWSHNTVSASSTRDIGLASRRLRQWFLRSLDSPIDLALLSKFNPDTQGDMSLVTSVIIRHMSRIRSLRSVVFDTFATLFPLNGDLASLQVLDVHTSDRSSGDASSQGTPILLSGSAPNLSRFSLNISPTSLPFDLLQVFTELSTLAAVSSLTITVEDAPPTIFQALESFVKLQYLNWTQSEDEDKILAPSEAPAISLPVLRTLLVTGSSALKGLAAIQGPVLENIAIRGEVFAPERVELTKKYAQFLTKGQTCPRLKTLRVSSPLFIGNIMISNAMLHALYWEGPALSLARHFKTIADWVSRSPSTHRINPTLEFLVVHCLDIESAATEILGSLADHMERCVIAIDTGASFHDESYEHFKFKLGISPELARSSSRFMELLTGYPTLIVETSEKYDLVFEQH